MGPAGIDPFELVPDALTEGLETFHFLLKLLDGVAGGGGAIALAVGEQDQALGAGPIAVIAGVFAGIQLGKVARQASVVLVAAAVDGKLFCFGDSHRMRWDEMG